ncbi:MFS-type transporter EF102, partial [Colletotrichum sp. SAR11_59]
MPFSLRPKTSKVSPATDDNNIAATTTITQQDASTTTSEAEKKTAAVAAMPNSGLRPAGPGFGKLGDEEYELRNVDTPGSRDNAPGAGHHQQPYSDAVAGGDDNGSVMEGTATEYRTYKRRWFGLAQLTLLNVIVSWD